MLGVAIKPIMLRDIMASVIMLTVALLVVIILSVSLPNVFILTDVVLGVSIDIMILGVSVLSLPQTSKF